MRDHERPKPQQRVFVIEADPMSLVARALAKLKREGTVLRPSKKYDRARLLHSSMFVSVDKRAIDRRARRCTQWARRFQATRSKPHPSNARRRYRARHRARVQLKDAA